MHRNVYQVLRLSKCQTLSPVIRLSWLKASRFFSKTYQSCAILYAKPKSRRWHAVTKKNRQRKAAGLKSMVPPGRFERPTPALGERCSIPWATKACGIFYSRRLAYANLASKLATAWREVLCARHRLRRRQQHEAATYDEPCARPSFCRTRPDAQGRNRWASCRSCQQP